MRAILVALLGLLPCAQSTPSPIEGAWQSNRSLTLAEFREARSFTAEQWKLLSSPQFFGHMIYVFSDHAVITVYDGKCSEPMRYELDGGTRIVLRDSGPNGETAILAFDGEHLRVPVSGLSGNLRETFTRVDLAGAARQNPCIREASHPS